MEDNMSKKTDRYAEDVLTEVEFTYDWYRDFLEYLEQEGFSFRSYADQIGNKDVLLRHDVDTSPEKALEMAELETKHGVQSTYFFLATSVFYNVMNEYTKEILREIEELGHDVGLHFSTHQYWAEKPTADALAEKVRFEHDIIARIVDDPAETICFHNPPDWVFSQKFPGFGHTYEPAYFDDIAYCSDTLQKWRDDPPFETGTPQTVQILVHPDGWGEDDKSVKTRVELSRDMMVERTRKYMSEHSNV
jgi:hypothetical protein